MVKHFSDEPLYNPPDIVYADRMSTETKTVTVEISVPELCPGDVIVETINCNNGLAVKVRREVPAEPEPVEGTIANFYGRPHVLLKRGRTLIAHADRTLDAELNNKFIWVAVDRGWAFREYDSPLDGLTPEIVFVPGKDRS